MIPDANVKIAEGREDVRVTEEGNQVLVEMRLYVATEEGAERTCPVRQRGATSQRELSRGCASRINEGRSPNTAWQEGSKKLDQDRRKLGRRMDKRDCRGAPGEKLDNDFSHASQLDQAQRSNAADEHLDGQARRWSSAAATLCRCGLCELLGQCRVTF